MVLVLKRHILLCISNVGSSVTCHVVGFAGVKCQRLWLSCSWFAVRIGNARNENGRAPRAIVEDLDVRKVGEDEAATLNQLFEHHVLVFPKQELTPDEQIAFAQHWGELVPFPYGSLPGYPNIIELRNRGKKRDVNQQWHSDMTYDPRPPKLTMLYALEAPAIGGETAFANQIHAYEELSTGMKSLVDSLVGPALCQGSGTLVWSRPRSSLRSRAPCRTHP